MCAGVLDLCCRGCARPVAWRKAHVPRADGYYDWRLSVRCGCGEVADPEVLALAKAAFDAEVGRRIYQAQEAAMARVIGETYNRAWNALSEGLEG